MLRIGKDIKKISCTCTVKETDNTPIIGTEAFKKILNPTPIMLYFVRISFNFVTSA